MTTRIETKRKDKSALLAELQAAGAKVRGDAVACPFHDDRHASGSVYQDDAGVWRFRCHAQECAFHGDVFDVRARATGRSVEEVLSEETGAAGRKKSKAIIYPTIGELRLAVSRGGDVEAEYDYSDIGGRPVMRVFRLRTPIGKAFRQASPVPGGWSMRGAPKPWPLYRLPDLLGAKHAVVVEGEKAAEALNAIGVLATTSPAGAGKAEYCNWTPLAGKQVTLWPDNDVTGCNHMKQVAAILEKLDPPCRIATLDPSSLGMAEKGDAYDFIERAKADGVTDLRQAVSRALAQAKGRSVAEALKQRIAENIAGLRRPVEWPWPCISSLARPLVPHTVTLLCGSPGSTKSFLLLELAAFWHQQGVKVALFCLEEDLPYQLSRVLAQCSGNSSLTQEEWQEDHPDETSAAYEEHAEFLDGFGRHIWAAPDQTPTLAELARWAEERAKEQCRVIAIDPVSVAEPSAKPWIADAKFVNEIKRIVRSELNLEKPVRYCYVLRFGPLL